MTTKGIAFKAAGEKATEWTFDRRAPGDNDVQMDILYCGICHSDIHCVRGDWGEADFPVVPGHEILGKVTQVGSKVTKFKVGDLAGVGCMVDSCRECAPCKNGTEQFCKKGASLTYNSKEQDKKTPTYGGYSTQIVTDQDFVIKVSNKFKDLKGVAPLLCAGITTFSPLNRYKEKVEGKRVGIVGLGGLGHMAIKFAVSMGAEVTVFSTSSKKEEDARKFGAKHFVVSKEKEAMEKSKGSLDFILDTVSAPHPITDYVSLLDVDGVMVLVGAPPNPFELSANALLFQRRTLAGSLIGGIEETQQMLDYCADHEIICDYEMIGVDKIDEAYDRTVASDVKYRFVIDISSLKNVDSK